MTGETAAPEMMTREEHERAMREFRSTVRTHAMDMARKHNLCSTVESVLQEVGIGTNKRIVKIVATRTETRTMRVPDDLIAAYEADPENLDKVIRGFIEGSLSGTDARAWQEVVTVAQDTSETKIESVTVLDASLADEYSLWFTSGDGRVKHYLPLPIGSSRGETAEVMALCGAAGGDYRGRWTSNSSRDEGRVCFKCESRLLSVQARS